MAPIGGGKATGETFNKVNFAAPRSFATAFKSDLKETFFPDDPFHDFKGKPLPIKAKKALQYFVPIFEWLPKYTHKLFMYDLLAGITIASLAIPQGISYAKLANIPPIIGLYSSFVPPLIYSVFGSSKHLAVGTVAASSLILAATIEAKVNPIENPQLYLNLVFTATLVSGVTQLILGVFRLGILVDFLSHSTITGFMGGTATLICLQQLKGIFGLKPVAEPGEGQWGPWPPWFLAYLVSDLFHLYTSLAVNFSFLLFALSFALFIVPENTRVVVMIMVKCLLGCCAMYKV